MGGVFVQRMGFSIYSNPRDTEDFCPDVEPDDIIIYYISSHLIYHGSTYNENSS